MKKKTIFKYVSLIIFIGCSFILIFANQFAGNLKKYIIYYYTEIFNPIEKNVFSNNYNLTLSSIEIDSQNIYGGLDIFNDRLFYIDGRGNFFEIIDENNFKIITLPKLFTGFENFKKDFDQENTNYKLFSIKDISFGKHNEKNAIYLSYLEYDSINICYRLSLSVSTFTEINGDFIFDDFLKIFQTNPCLNKHPLNNFAGASAGGRIEKANENEIYLSTGDFYFDGVNAVNVVDNGDYGKIHLINPNTGSVKVISEGHRNPQGLLQTPLGLFETEHGPQGGDELNLINLDTISNYGWPYATYGVDYGKKKWPLDLKNNNHKNYNEPLYFWIPSIGVSNLLFIDNYNKYFEAWENNLLVSSLKDKSIYRFKLNENQNVIGIERIFIGLRIRDLILHNNKIVLLEDRGGLNSKIYFLEKIIN